MAAVPPTMIADASRCAQRLGDALDGVRLDLRSTRSATGCTCSPAGRALPGCFDLEPRQICRDDEGRDTRRGDPTLASTADSTSAPRSSSSCATVNPSRHRRSERLDVGFERRHRIACGTWRGRPTRLTIGVFGAPRVVEVRKPVREARDRGAGGSRPACRRSVAYPSAAPVTTPSNKPRTPRISGTLSSAATKCISEVPGLANVTSTPLETSVEMISCAPFIGVWSLARSSRLNQSAGSWEPGRFPGPRIPFGSNACFSPLHESDHHGVSELQEELGLRPPETVLTGDGPAGLHAPLEQRVDQRFADLGIGLEHRQVDVPVARVAAPGHERVVLGRELPGDAPGIRGSPPGGSTTSTMSFDACGLRDEERALPCLYQLLSGVGGSTNTSIAPSLSSKVRDGSGVLVHALGSRLSSTTTR